MAVFFKVPVVAPLAGAWIEMIAFFDAVVSRSVAPLAGAWIEILLRHPYTSVRPGRSPRGSVD